MLRPTSSGVNQQKSHELGVSFFRMSNAIVITNMQKELKTHKTENVLPGSSNDTKFVHQNLPKKRPNYKTTGEHFWFEIFEFFLQICDHCTTNTQV